MMAMFTVGIFDNVEEPVDLPLRLENTIQIDKYLD
jgi:hypothetical protein